MQQSRREEYGEMLSLYMSLPDRPHSLIIVWSVTHFASIV